MGGYHLSRVYESTELDISSLSLKQIFLCFYRKIQIYLRFEIESLLQECLVSLLWIIHVIMFSLEKVQSILGVYLSGACTVLKRKC